MIFLAALTLPWTLRHKKIKIERKEKNFLWQAFKLRLERNFWQAKNCLFSLAIWLHMLLTAVNPHPLLLQPITITLIQVNKMLLPYGKSSRRRSSSNIWSGVRFLPFSFESLSILPGGLQWLATLLFRFSPLFENLLGQTYSFSSFFY